jgi:uncharacterized membrane protein YeaQ/YmgE (transglycosylase-associated protein family)
MAPGAFLTLLLILFLGSVLLKIQVFAFIIALIIWGFIGSLAGRIVRGNGFGFLGNVILGFLGGITGSIIVGLLRLWFIYEMPYPLNLIVMGLLGSVVFIFAIRLIDRNFAR